MAQRTEQQNESLQQLKSFLNELFQFESQDLDFGVYKILHYKRKEIKQFIDELLVDKVQRQLQTLTESQAEEVKAEMQKLEKDDLIKGWIEADEKERETLKKYGKDKIERYQQLQEQMREATVSEETENQIYNHLTLFFSRYYDKGDFISKRRFGKNEKYVVPYNGEETHFYWANHDQYYIKSSEHFKHYAFKVSHLNGTLEVNFKLTEAQTEQGNVKNDENKYFILSDKEPELDDDNLDIFFEYRPLTDEEKKTYTSRNKQDELNEHAIELLKEKLHKETKAAALWEEQDEKPLLLRKLNHYTKKNQYDFFIHKNLKSFLQRELDYYIKSELVNVDDLYVSETEQHLARIRHNLKSIKVFKEIADTIIEFLAQIENFQKKLWEKKKFVLNTEWVITIDRLVSYLNDNAELYNPILENVLKNKKQLKEWRELFGEENIPKEKLTIDNLKADLHEWKKLPIDTKHFNHEFKSELINALSINVNLEQESDGLVIHSDNYHGLEKLYPKYAELIDFVYIDPPYNTGNSGFVYKDSYQRSTWLTFIQNSIKQVKDLLTEEGLFYSNIDDTEVETLKLLFTSNFGEENFLGQIAWKNKYGPGAQTRGFGQLHEYLLAAAKNHPNSIEVPLSIEDQKKYKNKDSKFEKRGGFITQPLATKSKDYRPNLVYPIPYEGEEIWPDKQWIWSKDRMMSALRNDDLVIRKSKGKFSVRFKQYLFDENGKMRKSKPLTFLSGPFNQKGTEEIKNLFGFDPFGFPKPTELVQYFANTSVNSKELTNGYFLDFFAGSGTTFHAIQRLNKADGGKRKCILVEQGEYVFSVILPRIKKAAHSFDWNDGNPSSNGEKGEGLFLKYQRLEQYEESLENISLEKPDSPQQLMDLDNYIPKYFLNFESKNSATLVNTEIMKNPWGYKLRMWDGYTYENEQAVDLVETFNYLIGLHMHKLLTEEMNGHKYQFVSGEKNDGKRVVAVWRDITDWKKKDFEADRKAINDELQELPYDELYINGQAHIGGYQPIEEVFKNKMLP